MEYKEQTAAIQAYSSSVWERRVDTDISFLIKPPESRTRAPTFLPGFEGSDETTGGAEAGAELVSSTAGCVSTCEAPESMVKKGENSIFLACCFPRGWLNGIYKICVQRQLMAREFWRGGRNFYR